MSSKGGLLRLVRYWKRERKIFLQKDNLVQYRGEESGEGGGRRRRLGRRKKNVGGISASQDRPVEEQEKGKILEARGKKKMEA